MIKGIATWDHGKQALQKALEILKKDNGNSLDAVEKGINEVEENENVNNVGFGGLPDCKGIVTLDASIMNDDGDSGSVLFIRNYSLAISIARLVMEKTPHCMLIGQGAEDLASKYGLLKKELLTNKSKEIYDQFQQHSNIDIKDNHDTICILIKDSQGKIAGGCSTSGLFYKMHGRIGDSPIIGSGLYLDNKVGLASCTGVGELIMKQCSSFLVVELMRQGFSPQLACEEAIKRLIEKNKLLEKGKHGYYQANIHLMVSDFNTDKLFTQNKEQEIRENNAQVGIIAMNIKGEYGAYSIQKGFPFVYIDEGNIIREISKSYFN